MYSGAAKTLLPVRLISLVLYILYSCHIVNSLYEDQKGKFDWRKQFMGIPKYVYHQQGMNNLIVGTERDVVASLLTKDGSIIWRQMLPKDCHLNHMSILKSNDENNDYLVRTTCSSLGTNITHVWNPHNGLLVSDIRHRELLEDDSAESVLADKGHSVGKHRAFILDDDSNLVVTDDGKVSYQFSSEVLWSREESMSAIIGAEIVKLPSDMRDKFGLKKVIVILTRSGKVFGLDTFSGQVIWEIFDADLTTDNQDSRYVKLVVSKESDDEADASQVIAVYPRGLIVSINPITGKLIEKKELSHRVKQMASTQVDAETNVRGVIIMDVNDKIHVYPETLNHMVKRNAQNYYITVVDRKPAQLSGYRLKLNSGILDSEKVWTLPLNNGDNIVNVNIKRIDEEIHSPARVLGDRGILYKYVNPNLIAILTEAATGDQCTPDEHINIYLVDGVTGALVHYVHHPKSRGPSNMVHSENWLVYSYYSTKNRRTEISSLEMFEGIHQINSTTFSSLSRSPIKPKLIEHKSFIFPSGIDTMIETVTMSGMTIKHIIVALPSGALLEVPKIFLDPRRPVNMLMEHREEGLIPYMPELPIPSESMLNYDQTLLGIRVITTSPAILESTSLVFAYGLDIFFTRVTPSKTFDILKDDFDHVLISGVLVFLVVASLVSKYLAQRKALHAAWK